MSDYRSRNALTPYSPTWQDPDPDGPHHLAARMWRADGSIVLRAESIERLDWQDRELVRAIATRIYGPRDE